MTTPSRDDLLGPARTAIRGEILRWNPVMNLVSRRDTPQLLDRLLNQCVEGFHLVLKAVAELGIPLDSLGYVDVGSGNGLPGLLWAAGIASSGGRGPAWLVEPRKRRAWFLARVARQVAFPSPAVMAGRWGDAMPGLSTPGDLLVSMKALRLTEPEVLDGLQRGFSRHAGATQRPQRVVVVRFLGPDPVLDAEVVRVLQVSRAANGPGWRQTGCRTLEGPGVRLLATTYSRP